MRNDLIQILQKLTENTEVELSTPENSEHGDYSSNIALQMAKGMGKSPREVAEDLKVRLIKNPELSKIVEKIEVAGPGFINFFISKDALFDNLIQLSEGKPISLNFLKGRKIVFEYGQPNTHKMPHIGHLYSYIYGESTSRMLEAAGAEVIRANYQGDIGLHVAKCLWTYKKENPSIPSTLSGKVQLLQKLYQEGSKSYEEDENAKKEITQINKLLYEKDNELYDLWQETRSWSIEYYKEFEKRLGVKYDRSYFESEVYRKGIDIVNGNPSVFVKSQGAVIFEGKKRGLHDRVFLTSYGTPTYEAKDLALAVQKLGHDTP